LPQAAKSPFRYPAGKRWRLRLHEKGGKRHQMPVHHKLEQFLDEYLEASGIRGDGKTPLFRSAAGKTGRLTENPLHRVDAYQMIRRRTAEAGFKVNLGCHVFRATGITAYLEAGGTLENAQAMAAHESRAPPSSTIGPVMRSPSTRSSGLRFNWKAPTLLETINADRQSSDHNCIDGLESAPQPSFLSLKLTVVTTDTFANGVIDRGQR
jgi:hypothetical protein